MKLRVFWFIVLCILLIPIVELWGLIKMGQWIGAFPTILLVILTAIIGGYLAKREGMRTYQLIMLQLRNGELPGEALLDGAVILIGGILLLTPGFFSDIVGLFFLIPYTRTYIKLFIRRWLSKQLNNGTFIWIWRR